MNANKLRYSKKLLKAASLVLNLALAGSMLAAPVYADVTEAADILPQEIQEESIPRVFGSPIEHPTEIKVGFYSFPGFQEAEEKDGNIVVSGYGSDFLRLLRRYSDLNFEYTGLDKTAEETQKMLKNGEIDLYLLARKTEKTMELFDFSEPIGRSYTELTVRINDERFQSGEYSNFNNMRIGIMRGTDFVDNLAAFAEEKGFTYRQVLFDDEEEMITALKIGKLEGIAHGNMRLRSGERRVARFAPEDYYVAVRKGDDGLLDEINYGIEQMNLWEGDWQSALFYEHFGEYSSREGSLYLSQREKAYIEAVKAGEKTVIACAQVDRNPYSWPENGSLTGIIPDYFAYLMGMAGLPYTEIIAEDRLQYEAWVEGGEANLYMDALTSDKELLCEENSVKSNAYLQLTVARVSRRELNGSIDSIAIIDNQSLVDIKDDLVSPSADIYICNTIDEAMAAVKEGIADACYAYTYIAEKYVNSDTDGCLVFKTLASPVYNLCFAIASDTDHELISILNKCIASDRSRTLEDLIDRYTRYDLVQTDIGTGVKPEDNSGRLAGILSCSAALIIGLLYVNIRKKKKLNTSLAEALEVERKANSAKTSFLNNMSHDIRTPLNSIISYAKMGERTADDPTLKGYLEKIRLNGEHLMNIVNDAMDIGRIESGKLEYSPVPINLVTSTDMVIDTARSLMAGRDIEFIIERQPLPNPYFLADWERIRDVLINILSNAIKFTGDGGIVSFKASWKPCENPADLEEGRTVVVSYTISDNGIGMSPEFQEHIYEDFAQEDEDGEAKYEGTGLGLSIAKRYVDLMGGSISFRSKKNKGTEFLVELPLVQYYVEDSED